MIDMRDGSVVLQVYVQSLRPEVLRHHHPRLDYPGLLGKVFLAESLRVEDQSDLCPNYLTLGRTSQVSSLTRIGLRTVAVEASSERDLPTSLLHHSSVLSPEDEVIPGTTSGIATTVRDTSSRWKIA